MISSQTNFIELNDLNNSIFKCQWLLIKPYRLPRGINAIIFAVIYHPPGNDDNELRAYLFNCLDKAFYYIRTEIYTPKRIEIKIVSLR